MVRPICCPLLALNVPSDKWPTPPCCCYLIWLSYESQPQHYERGCGTLQYHGVCVLVCMSIVSAPSHDAPPIRHWHLYLWNLIHTSCERNYLINNYTSRHVLKTLCRLIRVHLKKKNSTFSPLFPLLSFFFKQPFIYTFCHGPLWRVWKAAQ